MALHTFVSGRLGQALADPKQRGCLFVNTVGEGLPADTAAADSARGMQKANIDAIANALPERWPAGRCAGDTDVRALAGYLVTGMHGLMIAVKVAPDPDDLDRTVGLADQAQPRSWPAPVRFLSRTTTTVAGIGFAYLESRVLPTVTVAPTILTDTDLLTWSPLADTKRADGDERVETYVPHDADYFEATRTAAGQIAIVDGGSTLATATGRIIRPERGGHHPVGGDRGHRRRRRG